MFDVPLPAGMWAPGIVGLVIGVLLLFFVSDSPEKNGYPPVEVVKQKVGCSCQPMQCGVCASALGISWLCSSTFVWTVHA